MAAQIISFPTHAAIPEGGAAHKVRSDACEPHLHAGQWAIIDFTADRLADFLLVKAFGQCPEIVTRQMQAANPRRRVLGSVVGLYAGRAAA